MEECLYRRGGKTGGKKIDVHRSGGCKKRTILIPGREGTCERKIHVRHWTKRKLLKREDAVPERPKRFGSKRLQRAKEGSIRKGTLTQGEKGRSRVFPTRKSRGRVTPPMFFEKKINRLRRKSTT